MDLMCDVRMQPGNGGADVEEQGMPPQTCSKPSGSGDALMHVSIGPVTEKGEESGEQTVQNRLGMVTRKKKIDFRKIVNPPPPKLHKVGGRGRGRTGRVVNSHDQDHNRPDFSVKKWVRLRFIDKDTHKLVGLQCQIYWPLDDKWYMGRLNGYNADNGYYHIVYDDGDEEEAILSPEKFKVFISEENFRNLSLKSSIIDSGMDENNGSSYDDIDDLGPGDIIWAKLTGHAAWPAIVIEEDLVAGWNGLPRKRAGQESFTVQFFGSHDFARVDIKQIVSFLQGLISSFNDKCMRRNFIQGLEEAKVYIREKKLPKRMLMMQNNIKVDVINETRRKSMLKLK